jgi:hypothetical protein
MFPPFCIFRNGGNAFKSSGIKKFAEHLQIKCLQSKKKQKWSFLGICVIKSTTKLLMD